MLSETVSDFDTIFYHVRSGDSLSKIIKNYYGNVSPQQQQSIISRIQADNPHITNPNVIHPGQALLIDIPQQYCSATGGNGQTPIIKSDKDNIHTLQQRWNKSTPQERELMSWLTPVMLGAGTASMMMIDTTFKTNAPLLAEMADNYNDFKARKKSRGAYDYKRKQLLTKLETKLGPTKRLLHGNKPASEVLRISRKRGRRPTVSLEQQSKKMLNIAKKARAGGVVLSIVGLGVACHEIANTADKQQKNEILVESVGALAGGAIYGAAAAFTLFLVATPIGWVGALAIGVGGALTGVGAGSFAKKLYNIYGKEVDLVGKTKVDKLCY